MEDLERLPWPGVEDIDVEAYVQRARGGAGHRASPC